MPLRPYHACSVGISRRWVPSVTILVAAVVATVAHGCANAASARDGAAAGAPVAQPALPAVPSATVMSLPVAPANTGLAQTSGGFELSTAEARTYMVGLINRDRAAFGLKPVEEDRGAALVAADRHAVDMARIGFVGHWGSDGSVPEQRYSEAGGYALMMENAFGYASAHTLVPNPRYFRAGLERAQAVFMAELPPHDGHRKNILGADHTHVAVGLAQPQPAPNEVVTAPCLTQEFVDAYVRWDNLPPLRAKSGAAIDIDATVLGGFAAGAVGVTKLPPQLPLAQAELNRRRSYPIAAPEVMFWPAGLVTPKPVLLTGQRMQLALPPSSFRVPALYEISLWGRATTGRWVMLALRTLTIE
jgi:uncharacterized protein YkwD